MHPKFLTRFVIILLLTASTVFAGSCGTPAAADPNATSNQNRKTAVAPTGPATSTIEIVPNSPADTVRAFYTRLREGKYREAIHLTNLRPAIEGLTDDELKEFSVDFQAIAKLVPAELEINGEIISGNDATVTAKLPGEDDEKLELQQVRLRKDGEYWVILSADEETEKAIKREGKNYFYALKIETHQEEAKKMLERIAKAQLAHSLQNNGEYAEFAKLIELGFLPADVTSSESTGYSYALTVGQDKKSYYATATPSAYGKTGKMSYLLQPVPGSMPRVSSSDNGGKPMTK